MKAVNCIWRDERHNLCPPPPPQIVCLSILHPCIPEIAYWAPREDNIWYLGIKDERDEAPVSSCAQWEQDKGVILIQ